MHRLQELVRLHRLGTSGREVARLLKLSSKTGVKYRKALSAAGLLEGAVDELPELEVLKGAVLAAYPPAQRAPTQSSVERWMRAIGEAEAAGVPAKALWDKLKRDNEEFTGSYAAVRRARLRVLHPRAGSVVSDPTVSMSRDGTVQLDTATD